jgi:predicted metalloprotease with PDZ domain
VPDGTRRPQFRLAVHHQGSDAELDSFTRDVEKIVREERAVFGEFAAFETNTYTFIADYLPWADGDGMEHRNSTVVTSAGSLRTQRRDLLDAIAHEFFHSWNVERIRPRSLEPFNLDETNMSSELWLAEGFTQYFGPLALARAGIARVDELGAELGNLVDTVLNSPGREVRTVEEMSQFAPFVDAAASIARSNVENTYISYYTWGGAIALGLDLTLRERSGGAVTLDLFMRELWRRHGAPGGHAPGYVDRPYTSADVQSTLAAVAGDEQFAAEFFAKYIRGHDVLDYRRLLALAGLRLRQVDPDSGYAGFLRLRDASGGVRVVAPTIAGTPAYLAGLDRDDLIVSFGGVPARSAADIDAGIRGRRPGESVPVVFERRGVETTATLTLGANPRQSVVTLESAGQPLTAEQQKFRAAWIQSRQ